jgi:hypothetical protein
MMRRIAQAIFGKGLRKTIEGVIARDEIAMLARLMLGGCTRRHRLPKEVCMSDRISLSSTQSLTAATGRAPALPAVHEELVADVRASLRPAEMVERKLLSMLRAVPMPVSMLAGAFRKR